MIEYGTFRYVVTRWPPTSASPSKGYGSEQWWRYWIGLQAFLDFTNGDLIESTRRRCALCSRKSRWRRFTETGSRIKFPKWVMEARQKLPPVVPRVKRREALALQAKLRDELLAKVFPPVPPEPLTGADVYAHQTECWVLPARISRVSLCWPKPRVAGRPATDIYLPASNGKMNIKKSIYHIYTAEWPDNFWLGVMTILAQNGDRIRRCPQCGKLFVKRTERANYCSDTCSLRGRQRKWITAHPEEYRKRRAAAYEKLARKRTYPRAKIQHRSRG